MEPREVVERLHQKYEVLSARQAGWVPPDRKESLLFFHRERDLLAGSSASVPRDRVTIWLVNMLALESFAQATGRLPRENNRLPKGAVAPQDESLARWLREQRRAIRAGIRCSYQQERLNCIPGALRPNPHAVWAARLQEYRDFISSNGHAPRGRSGDPQEVSLARWATRQRRANRTGSLSKARRNELSDLPWWTW